MYTTMHLFSSVHTAHTQVHPKSNALLATMQPPRCACLPMAACQTVGFSGGPKAKKGILKIILSTVLPWSMITNAIPIQTNPLMELVAQAMSPSPTLYGPNNLQTKLLITEYSIRYGEEPTPPDLALMALINYLKKNYGVEPSLKALRVARDNNMLPFVVQTFCANSPNQPAGSSTESAHHASGSAASGHAHGSSGVVGPHGLGGRNKKKAKKGTLRAKLLPEKLLAGQRRLPGKGQNAPAGSKNRWVR